MCMHSMLYIKYYLLCHESDLHPASFFFRGRFDKLSLKRKAPAMAPQILREEEPQHFSSALGGSIRTVRHRPVDFCKF